MDHVRLAPLADAVPHAAEADALAATLQSHFARDTFEICGFRDGAWLVRCADRIVCDTHDPAEVAGRNIHDFMPAGPDGARIRSLMNEVQMLLHDHPVNARRASTRALPINALWYWGFGAYAATPTSRLSGERWLLHADDLWLRAFWRAHGGTERPLNEAGTDAGDALVAMAQPPTVDPIESLAEVNSSLFARLVRAMQAGELRALAVHDGARVHTLDRHSRLRLWRRPARGEDL
jgi:hypothetical protein